jgi:hypothetical protein
MASTVNNLNKHEQKLIKEIDKLFDNFEYHRCQPKFILVTQAHYDALLKLENLNHLSSPYQYITHYQGIRIDIQQKKRKITPNK